MSLKLKLSLITALSFIMFFVAATLLRTGSVRGDFAVWGWGGIMIFSCISFVRGIFAIRRCK